MSEMTQLKEEASGKTELTLEEAFARLDEITAKLENPRTTLEESFALYKEGNELLKQQDRPGGKAGSGPE